MRVRFYSIVSRRVMLFSKKLSVMKATQEVDFPSTYIQSSCLEILDDQRRYKMLEVLSVTLQHTRRTLL
ncbi:hypothetical protein HanRHA438_Chr01g0011501 [Helianthus annuus]|nr:hypothetical protein HanRHA438_Chr01g0011501 [Helianthus annuus]